MKEINIKYLIVAEAEQELRNLANLISEEFAVDIPNSKGAFVDELRVAVKDMNEFRRTLVEIIDKTATALNNTIVSFKKTDESISYKG